MGFPQGNELKNQELCFFRVRQLAFDEEYPRREAFENVVISLDNEAFNFVYVLTGTQKGIDLCIGVVKNRNENKDPLGKELCAADYGRIIKNVFEGNFNGSRLEHLRGRDLEEMASSITRNYRNAGAIIGIPSVKEKENGEEYDFQGIDRLINSMLGLEWRLVVVCEPVGKKKIGELRKSAYELYNRLSLCAKQTLQNTLNDGNTVSFGKNYSKSKGKNFSYNKGDTKTLTKSSGNQSHSRQETYTETQSRDESEGDNHSLSRNKGVSNSITIEIANKHIQEIMDYMDEELLARLKTGFGKGLFKTSVYYMAKEPTHANRLKVGIMSLFQGEKAGYSPLYAQRIDLENTQNENILRTYQNQYMEEGDSSPDALLLLSRPFEEENIGLSTYLTTKEISFFAGLPQKEVPGISLKEGVGFGLNEREIDEEAAIHLGCMIQKGRELSDIAFYLSKEGLAKHTFIAGVTGSGKTTTCHKLLAEAKMPFLVIEPAKTEYRALLHAEKYKNLIVLTPGNEMLAPFRINPFELIRGEVISAHVDMVKATFTSAFPMEASMPQILEEAIYRCYEKKGWDIDTNINRIYGEEAFSPEVDAFPILSDLLEEMKAVVESKQFSQQMQADYIGSLVSRLSNLTVGSKGSMLNCTHSTSFEYIAHNQVILEMEELKSPEDKALLMDDKQKEYLSALPVGHAVIFSEHTEKPVHVHITAITDTGEKPADDALVRQKFLRKKEELGKAYRDLEVLPIYRDFLNLAKKISNMELDPNEIKRMRLLVKKIFIYLK